MDFNIYFAEKKENLAKEAPRRFEVTILLFFPIHTTRKVLINVLKSDRG